MDDQTATVVSLKLKPDSDGVAADLVLYGDEYRYLVSTIYRQCSAMAAPDLWYYEVMVFDKTSDRGKICAQGANDYREAALEEHARLVDDAVRGDGKWSTDEVEPCDEEYYVDQDGPGSYLTYCVGDEGHKGACADDDGIEWKGEAFVPDDDGGDDEEG